MVTTGIVYVPATGSRGWQQEGPGVQQIANRPMTGLILDALAADGIERFAVVAEETTLHHVRDALATDPAASIDLHFVDLGPEGCLWKALGACTDFVGEEPVLVQLATGLLGQSLATILTGLGTDAPDLTLLLHQCGQDGAPLGAATERLLGVSELSSRGSHLALAGVAVLGPGALARVDALADRPAALGALLAPEPDPDREATLLAPGAAGTQAELIAVADALAEAGFAVAAGMVGEWCDYSPEPTALLELNRCVLDRQRTGTLRPVDDGENRIEGRVVIDSSADVRSSVVIGPALIGPRARVSDAYIGPYTTIGADVVIEGSEVVRSIVGDGARIVHVNGRIEGSTIGRGANIFRDFTLPRSMRLHVGEGVELSLE